MVHLQITQLKGHIIWTIHLHDFGFKTLIFQWSWWLNQPNWKILYSQIGSSPQASGKIPKICALPPPGRVVSDSNLPTYRPPKELVPGSKLAGRSSSSSERWMPSPLKGWTNPNAVYIGYLEKPLGIRRSFFLKATWKSCLFFFGGGVGSCKFSR